MLPLLLEIHSFGPFAAQETIDFQKLGTHKLFLIYGPTGSGKTTILDAMCFALYGTTSGDSRTGAHMRSEYASPKEPTHVSFSFAIGDKTYRAERSPAQEIAKKRGQGTRKAAAAAALYRLEKDGSEKLLASKDVTAVVEQLLGFKADEFRQVVLLPQGEFRRLLLANSTDRQQIMQTLFHTQRYAQLEELAKKRRDEVAGRYETIKAQREQLLNQLEIEDESELDAQKERWQSQQTAAKAKLSEASNTVQEQQQHWQQAKLLHSQYEDLHTAERKAAALQQEAAAQTAKQQELAILRKAQVLAEPCRNLDELEAQGKKAADALKLAGQKKMAAEAAWKRAEAAQKKLAAEKEKYQQASARRVTLENLAAKVTDYARYREESAACQTALQTLETKLQQANDKRIAEQTTLEKEQAVIAQLAPWSVQAAAARQRQQTLLDQLQQEKTGQALQKECAAAKTQLSVRQKELDQYTAKAHMAAVNYEAVQAIFLQSQAAFLADGLQDGQPCPVCGARQHPRPAIAPDYLPRKEEVERQKKIAADWEKKRQDAAARLTAAQTQAEALQKQYTELCQQFSLQGHTAELQQQIQQAEKEIKSWTKKLADGEKMQNNAAKRQRALKELEKEIAVLQQQMMTSRQQAAQLAERVAQVEREVPPPYRQAQALKAELAKIQTYLQDYETSEQRVQNNLVTKEREKARAQEEAAAYQRQVDELRKRFRKEVEDVKQRVLDAGFPDIRACREKQPQLGEIPRLEKEITAYQAQVQQVQGTVIQAKKAIAGRMDPDLKAAEEKLAAANQTYQDLAQQKAQLDVAYAQWQKNVQQLAEFASSAQQLTEEYKTAGGVYELISGRQTGVNFERYILGALLDEVLQAANERLQQMSRQRYLLQRAKIREDKRSKSGLDLVVFDNYTGYERPANTLSGGETFLASLSLALGLADVVQAYSGGIHLDTIFIDEGFGTLDEETLDYALKTLMALKSGGRLVGIISHVRELKERIDARLAVKKTDRGSTTAFEFD